MSRAWGAIKEIQQQIERTLRNYDTNQGKEPERTTTVGGLAQFRADAQAQAQIKNYDIRQAYKNDFIFNRLDGGRVLHRGQNDIYRRAPGKRPSRCRLKT